MNKVDFDLNDKKLIVKIPNKLDISNSHEVLEAIKTKIGSENINEVEYDMCSCDFISSAGIGILVNTARQAKEKGLKTKMVNYNESIENILKITDILGYIGTE